MKRGIDHLVLCVNDLENCAAFYRQLGFTTTPRARHPWGTDNCLIQLAGSFIELLTVSRPALISAAEKTARNWAKTKLQKAARAGDRRALFLECMASGAPLRAPWSMRSRRLASMTFERTRLLVRERAHRRLEIEVRPGKSAAIRPAAPEPRGGMR